MKPVNALVLEDNDLFRSVLKKLLKKRNIYVTAYSDPESYLSSLSQACCTKDGQCFDLIITDNYMKEMTGLEFLCWSKKDGCTLPDHKKAIISSLWQNEDYITAQKHGFRVMEKELASQEITTWLDDILDNSD